MRNIFFYLLTKVQRTYIMSALLFNKGDNNMFMRNIFSFLIKVPRTYNMSVLLFNKGDTHLSYGIHSFPSVPFDRGSEIRGAC